MIEVVSMSRVAEQPWRNGGGLTRELLAWPSAADWQARISVADITRDGDFSQFNGIDRWSAVIHGAGVVLRFPTQRALLDIDSAPLHFDGASAPYAELQDGATRDLNLMVRRDAGTGGMQRAVVDDEWISAAPLRALFVVQPARLQIDDADAARLPAGSLAWSAHASRQRWRVQSDDYALVAHWLWFRLAVR
jgi:uncharacterized protein